MTDRSPVVELVRLEEHHEFGTFGVLKIDKEVFAVTLEPRDEENAADISSIPVQQYLCRRRVSPRFGETFEVTGVPGRCNILFHPGNVQGDTAGCILVAEHFGTLRGDRAVLNSGATFTAFMDRMAGVDSFGLTIHELY